MSNLAAPLTHTHETGEIRGEREVRWGGQSGCMQIASVFGWSLSSPPELFPILQPLVISDLLSPSLTRIVVCVLQVSGGPWVRKMFRRNLQPSLKDSFGDIPLEESQVILDSDRLMMI